MNRYNIKKTFLRKGHLDSAHYYKEKFNSNLDYVSNLYKSKLTHFKNPAKALSLIDQKLLWELEKEINKYEELTETFIHKLYNIPEHSISTIIFRIALLALFLGISQSSNRASISSAYIMFSILTFIFMIRRLLKTYGNKLYNELEELYYEIDNNQYNKINIASHKIENSLMDLSINRNDL